MKIILAALPGALLIAHASIAVARSAGDAAGRDSADATPATATAESATLGEVLVTARKKSEVLQDVPISVAAFDAGEVADRGIQSLDDLADRVPGLLQGDLAIGSRLTIRGVNSGDNDAFEQSVGTYVDGIYRGRVTARAIRGRIRISPDSTMAA